MTMIYTDIHPYFTKVAIHFWDGLYKSNVSIWDWLGREYGIRHAFGSAASGKIVVMFPDEKTRNWFILRWS